MSFDLKPENNDLENLALLEALAQSINLEFEPHYIMPLHITPDSTEPPTPTGERNFSPAHALSPTSTICSETILTELSKIKYDIIDLEMELSPSPHDTTINDSDDVLYSPTQPVHELSQSQQHIEVIITKRDNKPPITPKRQSVLIHII